MFSCRWMLLGLVGLWLLGSCDESRTPDTNREVDSAAVDSLGPTPSAETGSPGANSDTDTPPGETDGTNTPCPAPQQCGDRCCKEGELCDGGVCREDCGGGVPACGPENVCCSGSEICFLDECVTPGVQCGAAACATRLDNGDCAETQFCEPTIGRCLPLKVNEECSFRPPEAQFDPVPLFTWGVRRQRPCSSASDCQKEEVCQGEVCQVTWTHVTPAADDLPEFHQVTALPVVADLNNDCVPEIIFNSYMGMSFAGDGVLRAIRGDNGAKVWTVTDPTYATDATSNPAVGDLDGDGRLEVISQGLNGRILAFNSDGTPLWISQRFQRGGNSGSIAIANMDQDGDSEVIFGSAIYDSQGRRLFNGVEATGGGARGPNSCIADINGDGRPELIAGPAAYQTTGRIDGGTFNASLLWEANLFDGFCGIADFEGDGTPEVVLATQPFGGSPGGGSHLAILDGATGAIRADIELVPPTQGGIGAPNIADFNGDGTPDIGTAGGNTYFVLTFDGVDTLSILWTAPTEDDSSTRTGSSVFDFDGDGRAEVIYNDEEYIRIYPGTEPDCDLAPPGPDCDGVMNDDEILFRDLSSSRTRTEYPVIADANGDFKAEIVFSTSNEASFLDSALLADAGIEVWKDRLDNWIATQPIWNQHSYHITNVEQNGAIPTREEPSWSTPAGDPYNSYRRNVQGGSGFCAPDLIPRDLRVDFEDCPGLNINVRVVNAGCLGVGPGVEVAFFEEDLGLLGTARTQTPLVGGASELVNLSVSMADSGPYKIHVIVDNDGQGNGRLNECNEGNNEHVPIDGCRPIG